MTTPTTPVIIPAAKVLTPFRQGSFDKLCGLYAIINAIQIAAYANGPLAESEVHALYRHGISELARQEQLADILSRGMDEATLLRLAATLIKAAGSLFDLPLTRRWIVPSHSARTDTRAAFSAITREIALRRPVLAVLHGAADHCTVIVGWTASRLVLFDSAGRRWIELYSCGLDHPRSVHRHRIGPASAMSIDVAPASARTSQSRRKQDF